MKDSLKDSVTEQILEKLNIGGKVITHPDTLFGTNDMRSLPDIDRIDIYNYLITFKQTYDHKSLKAFKSLDGYQLYMAAYVENLTLCKNVGVENTIVLKFQVKPKQRKEDPLNKLPYYTGWIILDSNNPSIEGAYCACKGGADGACRHAVAALFEIAQYAEEKTISQLLLVHVCGQKRLELMKITPEK